MFARIMIGVDGHEGGRDAIALATKLRCPETALILAHVYSGDPRIYHGANAAHQVIERRRSLALLSQALEDAEIDARLRSIEAGSVGRGLHELADREDVDLLVLGSCRRGPLGRVLVGDDTSGALHAARRAVAVAPAGYARKRGPIREIGVGYDGSPESSDALDRARQLAGDLDATLSTLEVARATHTRAETAEGLAHFSASLDLLVVGSRRHGAIRRFIHGSTSSRLAGTARCPLLVFPRAGRRAGMAGAAHADARAVGASR